MADYRTAGRNTNRTMGPARIYAIVFGLAYLLTAATESILAATGGMVMAGDVMVLEFTLLHNLIHWATAIVLLAAFFASERAARATALTIGIVFALVTLLGFFAPEFTGQLMGHGGDIPWVYNVIHLVTAAGGLVAGLMHARSPMRRTHGRAI